MDPTKTGDALKTDGPKADGAKNDGPKNGDAKQTEAFPEKLAPIVLVKPVHESALMAAEFVEPRFVLDVPKDTPYGQLLDPKFYAHVANKVQAGAIIIARDAENTYRAELIVRNLGQGWVKVEELSKHEFKVSSAGPAKDSDHLIEYVNPKTLWRVVRLSDRVELRQGFKDWDAANLWLVGHKRTIAA